MLNKSVEDKVASLYVVSYGSKTQQYSLIQKVKRHSTLHLLSQNDQTFSLRHKKSHKHAITKCQQQVLTCLWCETQIFCAFYFQDAEIRVPSTYSMDKRNEW